MNLISRLLLLIILFSAQAMAQGNFAFDEEPATEKAAVETPASAPKLAPVSPIRLNSPAVASVSSEEAKTEARVQGECPTCGNKSMAKDPSSVTPIKVGGATTSNADSDPHGNACLRNVLLNTARQYVRRHYNNDPRSIGECATAVRGMLETAGLKGRGLLGDAIAYHNSGSMKGIGFKNIMNSKMTPENAPPGSVLVFKGEGTNMSLPGGGLPWCPPKKGPLRTKCLQKKRGGLPAGHWVGHVTIKGKAETITRTIRTRKGKTKTITVKEPNMYYTDARQKEPAIPGRTLVAVYVPVSCGEHCSGQARKLCGGK